MKVDFRGTLVSMDGYEVVGFILKDSNGVDGYYYPSKTFTLKVYEGESFASFSVIGKAYKFYDNAFPTGIAQGENAECYLTRYLPTGALFVRDGSSIFFARPSCT